MNDINKHCGDNLGGIFLFRVIPVDDVQSIPLLVDGKVCEPVILKTDKRWFDVYGTEGTMKYLEEPQTSEHGDFYKASITSFIPKGRSEVKAVLDEMKNKNFIIDIIDNNSFRRLVGTIAEPLKFSVGYDSGNKVTTSNGYSISFSGLIQNESPEYFI